MKKPPCPVCRSRRYRKDASGFYVCEFGHQLINYVEEQGDDEADAASNARRRDKKKRSLSKRPKANTTEFARLVPFSMICETFQFSLRLQVQSLIQKQDLPKELEHVVLDLWCAYLTATSVDMDDRQARRADWSSTSRASSRASSYGASSGDESASGAESERSVTTTPRRKLGRRARSRTPSQAPSGGDASSGGETDREHEPQAARDVHPAYSLIFCFLGCLMLRLPITLRDLQRWASEGSIMYFGTAQHLPSELTSRFFLQATQLEVKNVPTIDFLEAHTSSIKTLLGSHFSIKFPTRNRPLFWLRIIRHLQLPTSFYTDISNLHALLHGENQLTDQQPLEDADNVALALIIVKLRCGVDCKGSAAWMRALQEQRLRGSEYALWGTVELGAEAYDRRLEYVRNFAANLVMPHHVKPKGYDTMESTLDAVHPPRKPDVLSKPPPVCTRTTCLPTPTRADTYVRYEDQIRKDTAGDYHEPYAALLEAASDFIGLDPDRLEIRVAALEHVVQKEIEWIQAVLTHGAEQRLGVALS
ncbi:hypothetical protein BDZ88DRAFT_454069 [Geranomyces variabilis]|nr:hypothetical protein BDZ88DRAFT_454069 [Geranomyces variabilis]KAJ3132876.1 Pol I core factor CF [Geranomyces variabilis]